MSEQKQFSIEHGYNSEHQANEAVPDLKARLFSHLKSKGYTSFVPMPIPGTFGGRAYIDGDCRVIVQYILPWLRTRWADRYLVRVDTLVSDEATS